MKRLALPLCAGLLAGCYTTYYPYPVPVVGDTRAAGPTGTAEAGSGPGPAVAAAPRTPGPLPGAWRPPDTSRCAEHVVGTGDTLSQIAQARLGTMHNLPLLMLANPEITSRHNIRVKQRLVIPRPGYFAAPFLAAGEKATSARMLRWSEAGRTGFLGVQVEDPGPAGLHRFLVLEIRPGASRPVFDSAAFRTPGGAAGGFDAAWNWRALDLDGDGGLDLLAARGNGAGSGGLFRACAFTPNPDGGYARHVLAEGLAGGGFAEDRVPWSGRTVVIDGVERRRSADGWSAQPVRLYCRWTGSGFASRKVDTGPARRAAAADDEGLK